MYHLILLLELKKNAVLKTCYKLYSTSGITNIQALKYRKNYLLKSKVVLPLPIAYNVPKFPQNIHTTKELPLNNI